MFASPYRRWAPAVALAAGLAGCAGQQTGPGGALPHTVGPALSHPNHRGSWIKPEARSQSLVYVSDTIGHVVNVYTYPGLKSVGQLTGFAFPQGMCSDKAGNVWITDGSGAAYEYAHGGANPIVTLLSDMDHPNDCAVDPKTGDLAIANGNAQVLVFHTGSSSPTVYTDSNFAQTAFLGYDNQDNLFVDGYDSSMIFHYAELPAGGNSFTDITLNGFVTSSGAGGVRWDGAYMAVGDSQSTIYRTQGSNVVSTTTLTATCAFAFAIVPSRKAESVIAPDQCSNALVGRYAYPAGGSPIKVVTTGMTTPYGAALSR